MPKDKGKDNGSNDPNPGKPEDVDVPIDKPSGGSMTLLDICDQLVFTQGKTLVPSGTDNYFEYSPDGCFGKVPVRQECIAAQPEPNNHYMAWGWDWSYDGTITTPIDPITGIAYSTTSYKDLSYDPSSNWQDSNWWKSHGGRLYFVLTNYIRANQTFSAADIIKIVKAILRYERIGIAVAGLLTYFDMNLWAGIEDYVRKLVLASSGGSALFASLTDMIGKISKSFQEQVFLWPTLKFWIPRGITAYAQQYPHVKYLMFVPILGSIMCKEMIASYFDAFISTNQWTHPQTYLQANNLWDDFRDKFLPIIWGKQDYNAYKYRDLRAELTAIGWSPLRYDYRMMEFLRNKFWVHPFDETLGIGVGKLPKRACGEDEIKTAYRYYWDANEEGNRFFLRHDAYLGPGAITSPWLDMVRLNDGVLENYAVNDDGGDETHSQIIRKHTASTGTNGLIDYDDWFSWFIKYALEYQKLETIEPDPDITLESSTYKYHDLIQYHHPFKVPFNLPDKHWYNEPKKFRILYARYLDVNLRDTELFKIQRLSGLSDGEGGVERPSNQGDM